MKMLNRFSNFELLRIFLIIFVIILHYNDTSRNGALKFAVEAPFLNKLFLYLFESFSICAVNTFVLLSGYFMTKRRSVSIRKVVDLFIVVIFYSVFTYCVCQIVLDEFSLKSLVARFIPRNYYAWLYSTVFLLIPFLNLIMENVDDSKLDGFIILLLVLFSMIPTLFDFFTTKLGIESHGLSTISNDGNGRGFTLINFLMMYFIGGYRSRKKIDCVKYNIIGYLICSLVICLGLFFNRKHSLDYCNIFVVFQSIFFFSFFLNVNLKNNIINYIAKSVWGVFIIHGPILNTFSYIFSVEKYVEGTFLSLFINFFTCIISVFLISVVLEKIFACIIKPIYFIMDKIPLLNYIISIDKTL